METSFYGPKIIQYQICSCKHDRYRCKWQPIACQLYSDWLQMIGFLLECCYFASWMASYLFKLSKWLTYLNLLATCDWIYEVGQSRLDYLNISVSFEVLKFLTCCQILNIFSYLLRISHYLLTCPFHDSYFFKMSK